MPVERFGVKKNARSIKPFKFSELTLTGEDFSFEESLECDY